MFKLIIFLVLSIVFSFIFQYVIGGDNALRYQGFTIQVNIYEILISGLLLSNLVVLICLLKKKF